MGNLKLALKAFFCTLSGKAYFLYTRTDDNAGEYFTNNLTTGEAHIIINFLSECIKDTANMEELGEDIKNLLK